MAPAQCQDGRGRGGKSDNDEEWRKKLGNCIWYSIGNVYSPCGDKRELATGGGHMEGDLVVAHGTHSTCPLGPNLSFSAERGDQKRSLDPSTAVI